MLSRALSAASARDFPPGEAEYLGAAFAANRSSIQLELNKALEGNIISDLPKAFTRCLLIEFGCLD